MTAHPETAPGLPHAHETLDALVDATRAPSFAGLSLNGLAAAWEHFTDVHRLPKASADEILAELLGDPARTQLAAWTQTFVWAWDGALQADAEHDAALAEAHAEDRLQWRGGWTKGFQAGYPTGKPIGCESGEVAI